MNNNSEQKEPAQFNYSAIKSNNDGKTNKGCLMVFLWIFFLPIMIIITIAKSQKLSKKRKAIAILSVAVLWIGFAMTSHNISQNKTKEEYNNIKSTVESKDYIKAEEEIEEFMSDHSGSEYYDDVKAMQATVSEKAKKMKAAQKAKAARIAAKKEAEAKKNAIKKKLKETAKKAGITVKALSNLYDACEKTGIKIDKISNITLIDDWANGKRCTFSYDGHSFVTYFNKDETINSINSGLVKFFDKGKKVADLEDYLLTSEELAQLKTWTKDTVTSILKAPSTAKFPGGFLTPYEGWAFSKKGNVYSVSSYVDSQNSFGAMMRSKFTIQFQLNKDGSGSVKSFVFDGKRIR